VYKFENLLPFEILPLGLDAAISAPLLMLETLSKIFNGKAERQCFHWERCWDFCIQSQREYL
jgi:hypothetical protein